MTLLVTMTLSIKLYKGNCQSLSATAGPRAPVWDVCGGRRGDKTALGGSGYICQEACTAAMGPATEDWSRQPSVCTCSFHRFSCRIPVLLSLGRASRLLLSVVSANKTGGNAQKTGPTELVKDSIIHFKCRRANVLHAKMQIEALSVKFLRSSPSDLMRSSREPKVPLL